MRPSKVISGGQTGVDRAALDVALALGIPIGGWAPWGWRAEDGVIPEIYREHMKQTISNGYLARTSLNIREADATLILNMGPVNSGTARTFVEALKLRGPKLRGPQMTQLVQLDEAWGERFSPEVDRVRGWLSANEVKILNVAGPRESKCPGIYKGAGVFLSALFE